MSAHVESFDQKKKKYFKIFYALFVITLLEVGATFLPGAKIIRDVIICLFACAKAGAVGYYYMHLEHEVKWLRIVAVLPIFMLVYAGVLMPDTMHSRPTSIYLPERARVLPEGHGEHGAEHAETHGEHAESAAHEGGFPIVPPASGDAGAATAAGEHNVGTPVESAPSAGAAAATAPVGAPAEAAPAAAGGASADEWR